MKEIIRKICPPIFIDLILKIKPKKYGWFGDYKNWDEAKNRATGYDSDEILSRVKSSLLKVKKGEAVYERDGMIFESIQYSWPLLSGLLFASSKSNGKLRVLDFGGSLGSTYYQNKKFLDKLDDVSWNIVEQKKFIKVGKRDFEDERLHFYDDIEECINTEKPNVLVLASVLQYIENPYVLLDDILKYTFEYVIIDRTVFSTNDKNIISVQKVPPFIYNASYPCHLLSYSELLGYFTKNGFNVIEEFKVNEEIGRNCKLAGMILEGGKK